LVDRLNSILRVSTCDFRQFSFCDVNFYSAVVFIQLLRTCSEPDLAKLTRASDNPFMNMAASAIFDDSSNEDTDVEMDLDLKGVY